MIGPPLETINLRCPNCGHTFTQTCSTDHEGIILLENDLCPICGAQAEPDPP